MIFCVKAKICKDPKNVDYHRTLLITPWLRQQWSNDQKADEIKFNWDAVFNAVFPALLYLINNIIYMVPSVNIEISTLQPTFRGLGTWRYDFWQYFFCYSLFLFSRTDDDETYCRAATEYARACSHAGYPIQDWRDDFPACSMVSSLLKPCRVWLSLGFS